MSYNSCKISDYSRINPNSGAGFILSRLATRNMTKREVYEGTRYGEWRPGYHSSIWAKLLEDGLIMPWNGFMDVKIPDSYWNLKHNRKGIRAKGVGPGKNYHVWYFITELGKKTLAEMNARLDAVKKQKQEFCARNGIQFGTGKTLPCPFPSTYATNTAVNETRTPDDGKAALDKLEHFNPELAAKIDDVIRELQEIRMML